VVGLPPSVVGRIEVNAETAQMTKVPDQVLVSYVESVRRWFSVERLADHEFLIHADAEPWYLRVNVEGCEPFGSWMEPARSEVRIELARLDRSKKCRLFGRVVDPSGAPLPQARVVWERGVGARPSSIECVRGEYEILCEAPQSIWLQAWGQGLSHEIRGPIELKAGAEVQIDFQLAPSGSVRGKLLNSAGTPTEGDVSLWTAGPEGQAKWLADGSATSSDGFSFEGLGLGEYTLRAEIHGADWPAWKRVRVGEDVVLRSGDGLERMALVDGVVVDPETRAPLPGITVEGAGETDSRGRFRLVLPTGDTAIAVYGAARTHQTFQIPALAPGLNAVTVPLPKSVSRFVRIVDSSGRGVVNATIRVLDDASANAVTPTFRKMLSANGKSEARDAETDDAGRADLHGLPAGRLRLSVERLVCESGYWYRDNAAREFVLEDGEGANSVAVLHW
jgi:hypothetical protein